MTKVVTVTSQVYSKGTDYSREIMLHICVVLKRGQFYHCVCLFAFEGIQDQMNLSTLKLTRNKGITFFRISNVFLQFSFYERARKQREYEDDLNGRGRSLAFDVAYRWFEGFVLSADSMPDCRTKTLPSCLTKTAVYSIYKEQSVGKPLLARTTLIYSLWKAKFSHVIIPKVSLT